VIRCSLDHPSGPGYGEFKTDYESIFVRMARSGAKTRSLVVDHGNPSVMHGAKASSCVGVKTDQEVVDAIGEGMGSHGFVFGRLSGVAEVCGCKCNFLCHTLGEYWWQRGERELGGRKRRDERPRIN
jgi:hypothetical protein